MQVDFKKLIQGRYEAERLSKGFPPGRSGADFGFNVLNPPGLLYHPVIDEKALTDGHPKPRWPGDKPFAVCLTHDVDNVSAYSAVQAWRRTRYAWKELLKSPHSAERLTKRHEVDCNYAFSDSVAFDGKRCSASEMMQEIDKKGWEIGLHASWYAYNDTDELRRQKGQIEHLLGHEIVSVRQHYLHYDIRITPKVHSEAGFKYDSTLGFTDNVGFRFGTCYPWKSYDLEAEEELPVFEIPLIVMDGALLNPNKGMRLDEETAFSYVIQMADVVKRVGGVFTLLWHADSIAKTGRLNLYLRMLEYLKEQNAWFASVRDAGEWYARNPGLK